MNGLHGMQAYEAEWNAGLRGISFITIYDGKKCYRLKRLLRRHLAF